MKTKKHTLFSKKAALITSVVIVLAAGAAAAAFFVASPNNSNKENSSSDQTQSTSTTPSASTPTPESKIGGSSEQPPAPTPQPSGKSKVTAAITAANQNGSTVQIRSIIYSVTSSGTCTLTLTKGSSIVTKTAPVQAISSSSTCQGFDIPSSELSAGQWQIVLHFENDSLTGDATGSVSVE